MNIQPMMGRIIVQEIKAEDKTKGGLILPESAKERALTRATVIECGVSTPDYDCTPITKGSIVLFVDYAAAEFEEEGVKYKVLRYEDVHLVLSH